jgi:hypothetical protein
MGISTFAMDSFAGRGIVSTVVDQRQLGRLNMIVDLYRSRACSAPALSIPTRATHLTIRSCRPCQPSQGRNDSAAQNA